MSWSEDTLSGPEGEDWRVPVSELEERQNNFATLLREAEIEAALIQNPVDLYYFAGGRQNASLLIPADEDKTSTQFVRRSLRRAKYEAGGDDAPHQVEAFPRMKEFSSAISCTPALQSGSIPSSFADRFSSALGVGGDCTNLVHQQREVKSEWELEMMRCAAETQLEMFNALAEYGKEGMSELELVAKAETISREAGFGGNINLRRFPMQCDRGVIVSGRAGGIPSFFDAAVGGTGPYPGAGMGAGFSKIKADEPVLVDLLHSHRGYLIDMTRMFVAGSLSQQWQDRLDDMLAVKDTVVDVLSNGESCSEAWNQGHTLAVELGHEEHLMGMKPDQSNFLGHSLGLELDESPVVAAGFDRPMKPGMTMAIEPKVVHPEGSIGSEDTWVMTEMGMEPLSADGAFPWLHQW
ncbi:M24 family metallopeptidase [Deltaproteobacteria bacterium]|nr:M24 family metallopeptidase [Deltaproteobacteria bacterium]